MRITPLSTNSINYKQQIFSANHGISKQDTPNVKEQYEDSFENHQENPGKSGELANKAIKKVCYDKNIFDIEG